MRKQAAARNRDGSPTGCHKRRLLQSPTLLYATFSLIIVGLVQFIWPKRKLRHLLNP